LNQLLDWSLNMRMIFVIFHDESSSYVSQPFDVVNCIPRENSADSQIS